MRHATEMMEFQFMKQNRAADRRSRAWIGIASSLSIMLAGVGPLQAQAPVRTNLKKILVLDKGQSGGLGDVESQRDFLQALESLAMSQGFDMDHIGQNDSLEKINSVFSSNQLSQYQAVLFAYNDEVSSQLKPLQRVNLENYVREGGSLMAIHTASAFVSNWPWYTESLVQSFYGPHGYDQPRVDLVHDSEGLAARSETAGIFQGLTPPKLFLDRFFSFRETPRGEPGVTILVTMDEKTSDKTLDGAMGADHPVVWVKAVGKGKVIHNSLGHSWSTSNVYTQADGYLTKLTWGLLRYAAGDFIPPPPPLGLRHTRESQSSAMADGGQYRHPMPLFPSNHFFPIRFQDALGRALTSPLEYHDSRR
jgi:Trehalose utilisation